MRSALAVFVFLAFFGCLGTVGPAEGAAKNTSSNFTSELALDDPINLDYNVSELDTSEADSVFESVSPANQSTTVAYFYSRDCSACKYMNNWLESEKKLYNENVSWLEYDIASAEGWEKFQMLSAAYGVPKNESYVPMAFIGNRYYWGIDGIRSDLPAKIEDCLGNGCYSPFDIAGG